MNLREIKKQAQDYLNFLDATDSTDEKILARKLNVAIHGLLNSLASLEITDNSSMVESALELDIEINKLNSKKELPRSTTTITGKKFQAEIHRVGSNSVPKKIVIRSKEAGISTIIIEDDKVLSRLDQLRGFLKGISRDIREEDNELLND